MLQSLRRLERWKLIKIKEEENSEDTHVLPSSPLITPFSAEENNSESCVVRWGSLCVYVHSQSSTDEISVEAEIFIRVKLKGRRFHRLGCCLFGAGIFLLSFWHSSMVRSDRLIEKENINETARNFFVLIDLFRRISVWGLEQKKKKYCQTCHESELDCKNATIKTLPLPFLPMTSCDFSMSCESFVIRRARAAIPVRPHLWDQMCPLSQAQVLPDLCPGLFCQSCNCSVAEGWMAKC